MIPYGRPGLQSRLIKLLGCHSFLPEKIGVVTKTTKMTRLLIRGGPRDWGVECVVGGGGSRPCDDDGTDESSNNINDNRKVAQKAFSLRSLKISIMRICRPELNMTFLLWDSTKTKNLSHKIYSGFTSIHHTSQRAVGCVICSLDFYKFFCRQSVEKIWRAPGTSVFWVQSVKFVVPSRWESWVSGDNAEENPMILFCFRWRNVLKTKMNYTRFLTAVSSARRPPPIRQLSKLSVFWCKGKLPTRFAIGIKKWGWQITQQDQFSDFSVVPMTMPRWEFWYFWCSGSYMEILVVCVWL